MKLRVFGLCAVLLFAAGCQTTGGKTSQETCENTGMIVGALLGGLIGSQLGKGKGKLVGAVVGAAAAGLAGKIAGGLFCKMNQEERLAYKEARDDAIRKVPVNETIIWKHPDAEISSAWSSKREYENTEGETCKIVNESTTVRSETGENEIIYCTDPATGEVKAVS